MKSSGKTSKSNQFRLTRQIIFTKHDFDPYGSEKDSSEKLLFLGEKETVNEIYKTSSS